MAATWLIGRSDRDAAITMSEILVNALTSSPEIRTMLSEILIETVANGGSVSFMHPLDPEAASAFWDDALAAAARGKRIVLGTRSGGSP